MTSENEERSNVIISLDWYWLNTPITKMSFGEKIASREIFKLNIIWNLITSWEAIDIE